MQLRSLPDVAQALLAKMSAPNRLFAHHRLVHDVAFTILDSIKDRWLDLEINNELVLFGAAIHDVGKVLHPDELSGPGNRHEKDGPALLEHHGIEPHRSRFARTHGS